MFDLIRRSRLTPGSFQDRIVGSLAACPDVARVEVAEPFVLSVWHGDAEEPVTVFLDNAWASYSGSPTLARGAILDTIVAAFAQAPFRFDAASVDPARFVPLVRHVGYASSGGPEPGPWSRPLVGDLCVVIGYDGDRNVMMLPDADLRDAGWPPETALARGLDNFAQMAPGLEIRPGPLGVAQFAEDGFGWLLPTVLLRTGTLDALAASIEARAILIGLPGREPIYFADAGRPGAEHDISAAIHGASGIDHPQTRLILRHEVSAPLSVVAEVAADGAVLRREGSGRSGPKAACAPPTDGLSGPP